VASPLEFFKMSGSGNDFILGDNRQGLWNGPNLSRLAAGLCRRGLSVGADGLILLETSNRASVRLRIFNSDGGESPMCGNGARCAARFAFLKVMAGRRMSLETGAGVLDAAVLPDGRVEVEVPGRTAPPEKLRLAASGRSIPAYLAHTGVPHLVVFVKDPDVVPVQEMGAILRRAPELGPEGANVNFVGPGNEQPVRVRTFERGVEGETLACGTGVTAVAWVLHSLGLVRGTVRLLPRSGKLLEVDVAPQESGHPFRLRGEARLIYRGTLSQESIEEALAC
jgi:diaminopimelate epimerase